jgi:hypothetical protein
MLKVKTIDRFDVVRLNSERGLTSSEGESLNELSRGTTSNLQSMPFHPQWKYSIEAQQPQQTWFEQFCRIAGSDMTVELAYVEIARDFLVRARLEAERMHAYFLSSVVRPYERKLVVDHKGTSYYGERQSPTGTLSVYSDRPFKLAGRSESPCLHVEMRLGNLPVLLAHGLVTVQDLIDFDYDAFWAKKLHCVDLPSKTAMGRLLGSPGDAAVQDQAYRKRVKRLYEDSAFQFPRGFVLHNAALSYPRIRRLPSITFEDWEELARSAALLQIKAGR